MAPNYAEEAPDHPVYLTPYNYPGPRGRSSSEPPPLTKKFEMDTPIYNAQRVLLEPEDLRYTQFDLDAATAIAEERAASVESGQGKEKNNNDKKSRRIHRYRVPKKQENQVGETKSDL